MNAGLTARRPRLVGAMVLGLAFLVISGASVSAYHLTGLKWSDPDPITTWIYPGGVDSTAFYNSRVAWNNTSTPINFTGANNIGTEEVGLTTVYNSSVGWDGQTAVTFSGGLMIHATSKLNTFYTANSPYGAGARQSVAAHEMGHALGLDHTSGQVLMNPATFGQGSRWGDYGINTPRGDDVNGVNALY